MIKAYIACCFAGCTMLLCQPCPAQQTASDNQALINFFSSSLRQHLAWMSAPWSSSDPGYAKIRTEVEKTIADGASPRALLAKYSAAAKIEHTEKPVPLPPNVIYRWGLIFYLAAQGTPFPQTLPTAGELLGAFQATPFPGSAAYARVQFLVETVLTLNPSLKQAGRRLLKLNPNDNQVTNGLVNLLNMSSDDAERQEAVMYAKKRLARQPNDVGALGSLAFTYAHYTGFHPSLENYRITLNTFKQCLSLMKSSDPDFWIIQYQVRTWTKFVAQKEKDAPK